MNDNFKNDPIGNDIVSDNTDIDNKGEFENAVENVLDSQEGCEGNEEVVCQEEKTDDAQEKADDIQEKSDAKESEDTEVKGESASQYLSSDNVDIPYTPPTTYSATYYSAEPEQTEGKKKQKKSAALKYQA